MNKTYKTFHEFEAVTYQPKGRPPITLTLCASCDDDELARRAGNAAVVLLPGTWYPTMLVWLQQEFTVTPDALLKWCGEKGIKPSLEFGEMMALVEAVLAAKEKGEL
jgi:hypothetical protein